MSATTTPTIETEQSQRLRIVVGRLARLLRSTEAGSAAGLSPTRVAVLLNVARNGPVRLADVAAAEGINPTLLSRTVAHLAGDDLVARTADPDDRRSAWLELTAAGQRLVAQIRRERTAAVAAAVDALDERDRGVLGAALPALERLAGVLAEGGA